jgi:succinate dehydrogenase (ubiquinone) membrane anchor subunit
MASALRPTLLRQVLAAPAKRALTTSALPAFRVQRSQPMLKAIPRATFQTSATRKILPPLPQVMAGTINDAATVPEAEPMHGSYHWSMERCGLIRMHIRIDEVG